MNSTLEYRAWNLARERSAPEIKRILRARTRRWRRFKELRAPECIQRREAELVRVAAIALNQKLLNLVKR
jgi:hypothetical protein